MKKSKKQSNTSTGVEPTPAVPPARKQPNHKSKAAPKRASAPPAKKVGALPKKIDRGEKALKSKNQPNAPKKSAVLRPKRRLSKAKKENPASTNFVIHFWDPARRDRCVGYFVREIIQGIHKGDIIVQRIGNRKPHTLTIPLKCLIRIDPRANLSSD